MGWMELPFSLKKKENVGFEQATSESTIMKVHLIVYKVILHQNVLYISCPIFQELDTMYFSFIGNLKIIDRKKDLVKLQHGEYVSLGKVNQLKAYQPGDEKPY